MRHNDRPERQRVEEGSRTGAPLGQIPLLLLLLHVMRRHSLVRHVLQQLNQRQGVSGH